MKWQVVDKKKTTAPTATVSKSWVDDFAGKWQDERTTGNRLFLHIVYKEVDITFAAEQKTVANGK